MRRSLKLAVPAALLLTLALQQSALAATTGVSIASFNYSPKSVTISIGDTVRWTNNDSVQHTTTSDGIDACCPQGPSLWNSGTLGGFGSGQFSFVFAAAGKYTYHCTIHTSMKGTVSVPIQAAPGSGGTGTTFTLTWASGAVPDGFNVDVQIMRPGATTWSSWMTNVTGATVSASFTPDGGSGLYRFRSRLQNASTGGASAWSKAAKIQVR